MAEKNIQKDVKYLNKNFVNFRNDLIEFAKVYFPNTYNDFSESSPGMLFIEMAAFTGDVLSYYIDNQFKELLMSFAEEKKTIYESAQAFGYKPKVSFSAKTSVDIFQTVPAIGDVATVKPDLRYGLIIPSGMRIQSNTGVTFRSLEDVNFKFSSSYDQMTIDIFESDATTKLPSKYLLKKSIKVESGDINTEYFSFGTAEKYSELVLSKPNILEIISMTDSDGNAWKEVPFLAQDTVFEDVENSSANDPELSQYSNDAPFLLKLLRTPRRFTTYIRTDSKTKLKFGAGTSDSPDEELVPNPDLVGSSLPGNPSYLGQAFDPSNFLTTRTYGLAPSNTTLTAVYAHGGGVADNVSQGALNNISSISYTIDTTGLDATTVQDAKDSVAVTNPIPATGGRSGESPLEVKENALAYFQAQQRAVTKEDYIVRTYALPAKYGNIAKSYLVPDDQLNVSLDNVNDLTSVIGIEDVGKPISKITHRIPNPMSLNLYVLGFNSSKQLTLLNQAVKENLRTYLGQFRMISDAVNIKNAWIINIGVQFSIVTHRGFNKQAVLLRCIDVVKNFFNIDKWQINQPIIIGDLAHKISLVDGVASMIAPEEDNPSNLPIKIINKWRRGDGYSGNIYDIASATKNGIVYPSMDPSCFELRAPNTDIEGRAIGDI